MKRWMIGIVVVLAIAAMIVLPRLSSFYETETQERFEGVTVEAQQPKKGNLTIDALLTGVSEPKHRVTIFPSVPSEVESIHVKTGDYVNEGDLLFTLDESAVERQFSQAKAGFVSAEAGLSQANVGIDSATDAVQQATIAYELALANYQNSLDSYALAKENLQKYQTLYNEGVVSKAEFDQVKLQASEANLTLIEKQLEQAKENLDSAKNSTQNADLSYKQAEAAVTQAEENKESAKEALDDTEVTAPISGYVTMVGVSENNPAPTTTAAMTIEKLDSIIVTTNITEKNINKISKGDAVTVLFSSIEDKEFTGTVSTIAPSASQRTLLYPVEIEIDNNDLVIKPGMFADILLVTDRAEDVIYVESNAVISEDDNNYLYVVEEEKPVKRKVTVGLDTGDYIEIIEGLTTEEEYISKGMGFISQEEQIQIVRRDKE